MDHNEMTKSHYLEVLETLRQLAVALIPSAIGAFLGVVFQGTLTWTQRVLQFIAGVIVGHYIGGALIAVIDPVPLIADAIKLGIAMAAYEGARRFRASLIEVLGEAPRELWDALKARFGVTRK